MANELIAAFEELEYFKNFKNLSYGANSFNSCSMLGRINLQNITSISGATGGSGATGSPLAYTNLTEVSLPNLVSVSTYGFKPNGNVNIKTRPLNHVTIGSKWDTIVNQYALAYTPGVLFKVLTTTPPDEPSLHTAGTSGTYIYVPDESLDTYKAAPAFERWVEKLKPISECPF